MIVSTIRIRVSKRIIWGLFALVLCVPLSTKAQTTINAASCSSTAVQTALNSVKADGTIVNIPAGSCNWTAQVTYNQVYSTTIQGQTTITGNAGQGTPTGPYTMSDQTVITDNFGHGAATLVLNSASGKSLRVTGLTVQSGTSAVANGGVIAINGTSQAVRIDHNHFSDPRSGDHFVQFFSWTYGVVDHNQFDNGGNVFFLEFYTGGWKGIPDPNGYGQASWADGENFGTNQFVFVENNYFAGGFAEDCNYGGRFVFRYNLVGTGSKLEVHGTSGGQFAFRGCRANEVYGNTFAYAATPNASNSFAFLVQYESGTGLWWNNSISGFYQFIHADVVRTNNVTYTELAAPSGWGYCSSSPIGGVPGPSAWDGNLSGQNGRPCLDGIGRGKGDLLTGGDHPKMVDSVTGTITWPNQASVPLYAWKNTFNVVSQTSPMYFAKDSVTVENKDYYLELPNVNENTTFNGTAGVGQGLLSARPSTCTPVVGYWATDTNTLYQCTVTNTWTAYYTPYTYPHPLIGSSGTPPVPPTGLAAIVN